MSSICPLCDSGSLKSSQSTEPFSYAGSCLEIRGYVFSVCASCGAETVLPEQARINDRLIADAKRQHDGLLVSTEIREWRKALGLTQAQAAELLGGGANAFSKYERGEVIQSQAMDLLMRVAWHSPEARALLKDRSRLACERGFIEEKASGWTRIGRSEMAAEVTLARMVHKSPELMAANDELSPWHTGQHAHG